MHVFGEVTAARIYSRDPADPWNRLFHLLFTRTLKVRVAETGQTITRIG